jgi:hypothetical protein
MHWNVRYRSWEEFPLFEKYMALGETVAHLNLLEQRGLVRRTEVNQTTFYSIGQAGNETEDGLTDLF